MSELGEFEAVIDEYGSVQPLPSQEQQKIYDTVQRLERYQQANTNLFNVYSGFQALKAPANATAEEKQPIVPGHPVTGVKYYQRCLDAIDNNWRQMMEGTFTIDQFVQQIYRGRTRRLPGIDDTENNIRKSISIAPAAASSNQFILDTGIQTDNAEELQQAAAQRQQQMQRRLREMRARQATQATVAAPSPPLPGETEQERALRVFREAAMGAEEEEEEGEVSPPQPTPSTTTEEEPTPMSEPSAEPTPEYLEPPEAPIGPQTTLEEAVNVIVQTDTTVLQKNLDARQRVLTQLNEIKDFFTRQFAEKDYLSDVGDQRALLQQMGWNANFIDFIINPDMTPQMFYTMIQQEKIERKQRTRARLQEQCAEYLSEFLMSSQFRTVAERALADSVNRAIYRIFLTEGVQPSSTLAEVFGPNYPQESFTEDSYYVALLQETAVSNFFQMIEDVEKTMKVDLDDYLDELFAEVQAAGILPLRIPLSQPEETISF